MPMELRKLVFLREEVKIAAYGYCLHVGKHMPDAVVTEVIVRHEPELIVTLRFDVDDPEAQRTVDLFRGEVAAALIQYCRRIGVPIPRNARKGIQPFEDGVVMMINLNYQAPSRDGSAARETAGQPA